MASQTENSALVLTSLGTIYATITLAGVYTMTNDDTIFAVRHLGATVHGLAGMLTGIVAGSLATLEDEMYSPHKCSRRAQQVIAISALAAGALGAAVGEGAQRVLGNTFYHGSKVIVDLIK